MKEHKKNARSDVGASERAKLEAQTGQDHASTHNDTTSPPPGQAVHIADFLRPGRGSAIPLRDLVSLTGLRERDIRRQIERERRAGALTVSDNQRGYWLADDPAEAQRFARSMLSRAREIRKTARAVEAAAGRMAD